MNDKVLAVQGQPALSSRPYMSETWTVVGGAKKRTARAQRKTQGNTLRVDASTPGTEYGTPFETSTDDDAEVADGQLHRGSGRQLVVRAAASRSIVSVSGASSKLNESDLACINGDLVRMLEIFSHLGMMAEQQRAEIVTPRTTVTEREDAWRRDRVCREPLRRRRRLLQREPRHR
ncbi:hypothetical protein ACJJTC_008339 [Scirpophaga incertulas]